MLGQIGLVKMMHLTGSDCHLKENGTLIREESTFEHVASIPGCHLPPQHSPHHTQKNCWCICSACFLNIHKIRFQKVERNQAEVQRTTDTERIPHI